MKREDWVDRLWSAVAEFERTPFEYGRHDCCVFVARVLDELNVGANYLERIRKQYKDEASARALIARSGGLRGAVSEFLGEPNPPAFARRGDAVLVKLQDRELVGICLGNEVACAGDGLVFYSMQLAACCWRVDE